MDKISRAICHRFSECQGQKASSTAPIGSTQNVGSSVKGERWPAEYDSSPMLLRKTGSLREHKNFAQNLQLESRVLGLQFLLD